MFTSNFFRHMFRNTFDDIAKFEQNFFKDFDRFVDRNLKFDENTQQKAANQTHQHSKQESCSSHQEVPKQQEAPKKQEDPYKEEFFKDISQDQQMPKNYSYTYLNRHVQEEGKEPVSEIRMHFKDQNGQEKFQQKRRVGELQETKSAYRKTTEDKLERKYMYDGGRESDFTKKWSELGFKDDQNKLNFIEF